MSKHYFIADTHFGHSNIHLKFRKEFSSQEEHNDTIHQNILSTGNKTDCLWLLGDISFKESEFWRLSEYAKKFQQVYYILGNHDAKSVFRHAVHHKNISVLGVEQRWGLWLTHVPVPDYELYRGNCIHGHLHNKIVEREVFVYGNYIGSQTDDRYFCVSCEQVDYKPISLDRIKEIRGWK